MADEEKAPGLITVKSALKPTEDGGNPTAIWEVDPAHPKGEIFIAGPGTHEVAETPGVLRALENKSLARADAPKKDKAP